MQTLYTNRILDFKHGTSESLEHLRVVIPPSKSIVLLNANKTTKYLDAISADLFQLVKVQFKSNGKDYGTLVEIIPNVGLMYNSNEGVLYSLGSYFSFDVPVDEIEIYNQTADGEIDMIMLATFESKNAVEFSFMGVS